MKAEILQDATRIPRRTQVSSKYTPDNPGVFRYKDLVPMPCSFPRGNEIILYTQEFAITTPDEAVKPFDVTQIEFFRSIRENPVHFVYNVNGEDEGYMGESTSIETAYSMAMDKPILVARKNNIHFGERVPTPIKEIITKNMDKLNVGDLEDWINCPYVFEPEEDIAKTVNLHAIRAFGPHEYDITPTDRKVIMKNVYELTRKYRQAWNAYRAEAA